MQISAGPLDLLIFALLALALLGAFIFFLLKAYFSPASVSQDGASIIYDAQLNELEADKSLGTIDEAEFNSAKNEILRRLLNANRRAETVENTAPNKIIPIAIAAVSVLATILIYSLVGSPFRKDEPIAQRTKNILASDMSKLSADEVMLVLLEKSKAEPNADEPHLFMGKILTDKGQYQDALQSFQAALRRNPKNPEALAEYAGTIFELNGGVIDGEFEAAINAALKLQPDNQSALFYLGKAYYRNDKKAQGLEVWRKAYDKIKNNEASKNAFVLRLMSELSRLDAGPKAMAMGEDAAQFGTPEFIKSMVARRESRLIENPKDLGLRLSYANVISKSDATKALEILKAGLPLVAQDQMQKDILDMTILIQTKMSETK